MQYVCVDIGGTFIKYAMMTEDGRVLTQGKRLTGIVEDGIVTVPFKISAIVRDLQNKCGEAVGIAVCSPGLIDAKKGEVIFAGPNFPGYSGMKLREEIEALTHLPCTVENDVNAAGLGESWLGAGRGFNNVFCLFVGTGIGGSVVINGHLVRGASAAAGEVGFLRFAGVRLENLASMSALLRKTGVATGEEVFQHLSTGDEKILVALEQMSESISCCLAEICCIINPEVLILGGAVMAQQSFFEPRLNKYLTRLLPKALLSNTRLAFAELGTMAGCTGALKHFLQTHLNSGGLF